MKTRKIFKRKARLRKMFKRKARLMPDKVFCYGRYCAKKLLVKVKTVQKKDSEWPNSRRVFLVTPLSTRNHHSKSVEFGSNFKFSQICQIWAKFHGFWRICEKLAQIPQILSGDFGWRVVLWTEYCSVRKNLQYLRKHCQRHNGPRVLTL